MEKICIFGASGFVGRALVERLLVNDEYSSEFFAKFENYYDTLYGYKSEYWDLIASACMLDSN